MKRWIHAHSSIYNDDISEIITNSYRPDSTKEMLNQVEWQISSKDVYNLVNGPDGNYSGRLKLGRSPIVKIDYFERSSKDYNLISQGAISQGFIDPLFRIYFGSGNIKVAGLKDNSYEYVNIADCYNS